MKKIIILLLVVILCFIGCGSTGGSGAAVGKFADVIGKELKLVEVYIEDNPFNRKVIYDRSDLKKNKIEKTYTISLKAEQISGIGAPNTYSAPYKLGEGQTIEIDEISSTNMAPITQPEKLQEFVFYSYLQNAYEWSLDNGKLVLTSKNENQSPVKLVFSL